jgi:YgiT-type zinc finger domain-containing protein
VWQEIGGRMTELMKRYMISQLEAKAKAYDRLMSGGLKTIIKTIKEFISTIPDSDVWWCPNCGETECSSNGRCVNCGLYIDTPDIEAEKIKNTFTLLLDSLTLPDVM